MKKILLPIASTFLAYETYQLLVALERNIGEDIHWAFDFFIAYIISLFTTGIFAFVGFAYPTSKLIGQNYYRLKNPKHLLFWFNILGIDYFRKALLLFFWGTKKNRKKYFNGTRNGIKNFIYQTHQSEFGHLGALIVIITLNFYTLYLGYYLISIFLCFFNFIGNLYPILLQRHHRIRLKKFII